MKTERAARGSRSGGAFRTKLLVMCAFFAVGAVLGMLMHRTVSAQEDMALRDYLVQYAQMTARNDSAAASALSVLLVYFRCPLLLLLCGCTAFGLVLIPALCAAQGFSLGFSLACFAAALGRQGVVLALAAFGIRSLFTLPCILFLAVGAADRVLRLLGRENSPGKKRRIPAGLPATALCLAVLLLGAAVDAVLTPRLLHLAAEMIL